jgi:tryptophanyl-tRNA synthetase
MRAARRPDARYVRVRRVISGKCRRTSICDRCGNGKITAVDCDRGKVDLLVELVPAFQETREQIEKPAPDSRT